MKVHISFSGGFVDVYSDDVVNSVESTGNNELPGVCNVGDVMEFTLTDGEPVAAMVVKVDNDIATLIFFDCLKDEIQMRKDGDYSDGYESSDLRETLNSHTIKRFPSDIREKMVPFVNGDYLRIPTEKEIFGVNKYGEAEPDDVEQFEPMKLRRNRIAFQGLNGNPEWYWLQNRSVSSAANACLVIGYGGAAHDSASTSFGVRPLFQYRIHPAAFGGDA